ncbi:hypothetical protein CIB95_09295 [Lottiidibacillus patelloidae]|uniref:DUF4382 domain-containing protein n=1 Tax=Lottiidibacillus patelloidae TaxID=2670334 RepID=A0A263BTE9_9BACI|nr:hypothetical protein [Lottiidibacillus patelloidae]OZM56955.1 hypothetical protein CIB95_09295 [Lottiidibacillus patelloidae]
MSFFNKVTCISFVFILIAFISSCSSTEDTPVEDPTIVASFTQQGDKVTITWSSNITISAEHYGQDHVEGEGHVQVLVNGKEVATLKNRDPYIIEGLSPGTHEIKLELRKNNLEPYGVERLKVIVVKAKAFKATLDAEIVQSGNNVTITLDTNVKFSAENYGGAHIEGEGHGHIFVDGVKVFEIITNEPLTIEGLTAGKHVIEITLQKNDHRSYGVSKRIEVEIK